MQIYFQPSILMPYFQNSLIDITDITADICNLAVSDETTIYGKRFLGDIGF